MKKEVLIIKCGLFRKNHPRFGKNICIREGRKCNVYIKHKGPYCFVADVLAFNNNVNKLLYKAGRLKIEVEQSKDIYGQKYYE